MTYRLVSGPSAGEWRTAVLVETRREISGNRHGAWVRAAIVPVAVVLMRAGEVRATDAAGRPLALSVLEDLHPGLGDQIARLA